MHFRITCATLGLMILCVPSVFGQAPQAPQAQKAATSGPIKVPSSIGLVDIGYLLKKHPTMDAKMLAIQEEMTRAQEEIESRRKSLLSETEIVGKYNQDSPEFKQKQEFLISQESKLRVDFMRKEKEFAEKNAGVIFESYQTINIAIEQVAKHHDYDLILRYSREQSEMDPKKPQTVNFGIQRDVLFFNPQVDVTEYVLSYLTLNIGPLAAAAAKTVPVQTAGTPAPQPTTPTQPIRQATQQPIQPRR